jgi:hypothetical protein
MFLEYVSLVMLIVAMMAVFCFWSVFCCGSGRWPGQCVYICTPEQYPGLVTGSLIKSRNIGFGLYGTISRAKSRPKLK